MVWNSGAKLPMHLSLLTLMFKNKRFGSFQVQDALLVVNQQCCLFYIFACMSFVFLLFVMQRIKKNRDPRWDEEFQFRLEEPPTNDRLHVEVYSTSSRMGLLHSKVCFRLHLFYS